MLLLEKLVVIFGTEKLPRILRFKMRYLSYHECLMFDWEPHPGDNSKHEGRDWNQS